MVDTQWTQTNTPKPYFFRLAGTAFIACLAPLVTACEPIPDATVDDQCPDFNYDTTSNKDAGQAGLPGSMDTVVEEIRLDRGFPGCGVAITDGDNIVYAQGYGARDIGGNPWSAADDTPWDLDTVSVVGSVSKMLTATALMRLHELGEIDIDDDLASFFPYSTPAHWNTVSLRDVLQHRAGFVRDANPAHGSAVTPQQIDDAFGELHASQHPRYGIWQFMLTPDATPELNWVDHYRYSNVGYYILGAVIDLVTTDDDFTGNYQGYEPYVWSVVNRLGQASVTACLHHDWRKTSDIPNHAVSYTATPWSEFDTPYSGLEGPAGGWSMTVPDLARFLAKLNAGEVVSPASLAEMRDVPDTWVPGEPRYGLGMFLDPVNSLVTYGHGGVYEGFRAQTYTWPNEGVSVAVMCNADVSGVGLLASQVGALYMASR